MHLSLRHQLRSVVEQGLGAAPSRAEVKAPILEVPGGGSPVNGSGIDLCLEGPQPNHRGRLQLMGTIDDVLLPWLRSRSLSRFQANSKV